VWFYLKLILNYSGGSIIYGAIPSSASNNNMKQWLKLNISIVFFFKKKKKAYKNKVTLRFKFNRYLNCSMYQNELGV
jgi:hypothetical protein